MTPEAIDRILDVLPSSNNQGILIKNLHDTITQNQKAICLLLDSMCEGLNAGQTTFVFQTKSNRENQRAFEASVQVLNRSTFDQRNLIKFEANQKTGGRIMCSIGGLPNVTCGEGTPLEVFVEEHIKEAIIRIIGVGW